jgi:RNA polymerase sigma-70 factor, ECF subfamily
MSWLKLRRRRKDARRLAARSNEEWVGALRSGSPGPALDDLRIVLIQALLPILRTRVPEQPQAMAEDIAQSASLHILDRLDSFRGEARFTTWAAKVAVRLALSELRRQRWQNVSLDDLMERGAMPGTDASDPVADTIAAERAAWVARLIEEELTERQRIALQAVMIHGMAIEEVAQRLDTNRNALYKLLHDARLRLRKAFEDRGLSLDDFITDD